MKMKSIALAFAVSILLTGCAVTQPSENANIEQTPSSIESATPEQVSPDMQIHTPDIDKEISFDALLKTLSEFESNNEFSGTVLIARDNDILLDEAYGFAARGVPMQTDTKLNLGSIGKSFTAVAICQLAQTGKLSYDDVVETYVPELAALSNGQMTIRHLLNHTSGLGSFFEAPGYMDNKDNITTINEMMPYITYAPLQFNPGERSSYSNSGYIVLGLIIEAVSGQDYYTYVNENVFQPAGMVNTGNFAKTENIPNLAIGYTGSSREDNTDSLPSMGSPAGGGYSTTGDMLRFVNALKDGTLLNNAIDELVNNAISPVSNDYGFGMMRFPVGNATIVGHNGGAPGISAQFEIYLDSGYTVVVLSNYDDAIFDVIDAIRRELLPQGEMVMMPGPDMSNAFDDKVTIDGQPVAVRSEPTEINSILYIPADDISKGLGGKIRMTPSGCEIDVNNIEVVLTAGSETVVADGKEYTLSARIEIINPCIMVPVEFLEIVYGYTYSMDDGVLNITTK